MKSTPERRSILDYYHKKQRLKRYGLSIEEFDHMREDQGDCCAICDGDNNVEGKDLAIDHNHNTGKVRALLCQNCNAALGHVKEDVSILEKMIDYIRKHNE